MPDQTEIARMNENLAKFPGLRSFTPNPPAGA